MDPRGIEHASLVIQQNSTMTVALGVNFEDSNDLVMYSFQLSALLGDKIINTDYHEPATTIISTCGDKEQVFKMRCWSILTQCSLLH